jgi:signal transduction histidine kinase
MNGSEIEITTGDPLARDPEALLAELEQLRPLAELGRLAATVAHEVRNPLAGISANAELVREALSDPADQESVDMIMREVDRLSALVADLLHYAKEREAREDAFDLAREARNVCDLLHTDAEQSGVPLRSLGRGFARGDAELSRQCLLNIVRNAIQACRPAGVVELQVDAGTIIVRDQGMGVPPGLQESMFEPFVTGRTRGLGLGCAVAKRCMHRQDGEVVLLRTGEQGSEFALTWPTAGD